MPQPAGTRQWLLRWPLRPSQRLPGDGQSVPVAECRAKLVHAPANLFPRLGLAPPHVFPTTMKWHEALAEQSGKRHVQLPAEKDCLAEACRHADGRAESCE